MNFMFSQGIEKYHARAFIIQNEILSIKPIKYFIKSMHINCKADDTSNYEKHAN